MNERCSDIQSSGFSDSNTAAIDSPAWRSELIERHLWLVRTIAHRLCSKHGELGELIAEGNAAMVDAAARFDADRGIPFAAYAEPWIRHAIRAARLRYHDIVNVPPAIKRLTYAYRKQFLSHPGAPEASVKEVAAKLRVSPATGAAVIAVVRGFHSASNRGHSDEQDVVKLLAATDMHSDGGLLESAEDAATLHEALRGLDANIRRVVELAYGLGDDAPMVRHEIAAVVGVSVERVDFMLRRAMADLRTAMADTQRDTQQESRAAG